MAIADFGGPRAFRETFGDIPGSRADDEIEVRKIKRIPDYRSQKTKGTVKLGGKKRCDEGQTY